MPTHEADIIIVGGGTAGLIPALWYGLLNTENEWGFNITPQAALGGKAFRQPQGRQLGGCSGLNGGVFIANSAANLDAWGALGNEGWDWETLGPYYRKKIEDLGLEYVDLDENGVSGSVDGPIQASFPDAVNDASAGAWVRTLRGLGYTMSGDPFSGEPVLGGYINALATDPVTKTRSYSANSYYLPVKDRPNLRVVTRVVFESSAPDAEPSATSVILSAGAINTPKLLELFGIGSPAILNQFGIPVRVDNPHVGENLQDHAMAGVSFEVEDSYKSTLDDLARQVPEALETAMRDYQTNRTGPFTVGGFYSSALMSLADFADLETSATAAYFTHPSQVDFRDTGVGASHPPRPENYITIFAMLVHPLSRGSTHITSVSHTAPPLIDPRYLTHPADVEILSRHVRFIDTIVSSPPFSDILKPEGVGKRSLGVPANLRTAPLDEIATYVRSACMNNYHTTGTCAMMPREKGGVVDHRLRVYGVKGLRVVDTSVVPIISRGNTQSTVYAVAERAADLVSEDYQYLLISL
ncbi:hypothetical protein BJX62DRAFT_230797 [Aspergillus germanicus]